MSNLTLFKDPKPAATRTVGNLEDLSAVSPIEKRRNDFLSSAYKVFAEVVTRDSVAFESSCNAFHLMLEFRERLLDHQTQTHERLLSFQSVLKGEGEALTRELEKMGSPTPHFRSWVKSVREVAELIPATEHRQAWPSVLHSIEEAIVRISPELHTQLPALDQELGALKKLERSIKA